MRFESDFGKYDDEAISINLTTGRKIFFQKPNPLIWGSSVYNKYCLREKNNDETWRLSNGKEYERFELNRGKTKWINLECPFDTIISEIHPRAWGVLTLTQMYEYSKHKLLHANDGMVFKLVPDRKYVWDLSFGYYFK